MKMFVPAVGYRIKLSSEWKFSLYYEDRNDSLLVLFLNEDQKVALTNYHYRYVGNRYGNRLKSQEVALPADTVLEVDRVYVRTMNKTAKSDAEDYDSITFKIVSCPTLETKKKPRFWAKLSDVNNIEYELPPDFSVSKDKARENAKKPKKLTPKTIREIVSKVVHGYLNAVKNYGRWKTQEFDAQLKLACDEYVRVREPFEKKVHDDRREQERARINQQIANGTYHMPINWVGKVGSVDDLVKLDAGWANYFAPFSGVYHGTPYHVVNTILNGGSSFERLPDGTCKRTFRPVASQSYELGAPSLEHLYAHVYSNADDTQITKVEVGFDAPRE